ncbi:MAG: iron-containing alcohol dehydrogenase [Litoreibacter sp.]
MTLITNPTRVHFADDVLQEALQAELERAGCKHPLLVAENTLMEGEFADRIHAGLPHLVRPNQLSFARQSDLKTQVRALVEEDYTPDVIIAFGSARAIELSRKCRYALAQKNRRRPLLFAVPGIDGMPNPCTRNLESWRAGLPSILICDPTVALNADQNQSLRAVVISLVRCVESYLADAFNPPADGMALDGLSRCVKILPRTVNENNLNLQREVMAAGLNAAFSQEKGIGPASVLTSILMDADDELDEAELARLILTGVVRTLEVNSEKEDTLLNVLGGDENSLEYAVARVLEWAPKPRCLSDLGLSRPHLDAAASNATGRAGLSFDSARALLDDVY